MTLESGNVLQVSEGGSTYDLQLDPTQSPAGHGFALASDGHGGTTIVVPQTTFAVGSEATLNTAIRSIDVSGNLTCNGAISGSEKNFRIDDPLDPANKTLVHASVESSERMNIYTGNVTTDELGLATITLPEWFESLNTDFRYQLTTIGRDAHAWVAKEVANGKFQIATNATNVKVSWQITAVRQDAYAKANPMVVEQEKPAAERGHYIRPELYGQPLDKQIGWELRPQQKQSQTKP